jgi:sec-independent protein translocase protein TatB
MDIFGIGFPEMIIIGLVIVLVAGPERSKEWARQLGLMLVQFRDFANEQMDELKKDLEPEEKEFIETAFQVRREVNQITKFSNPRQAVQGWIRDVEKTPSLNPKPKPRELESGAVAEDSNTSQYLGWTRPASDDNQPPEGEAETPENQQETP